MKSKLIFLMEISEATSLDFATIQTIARRTWNDVYSKIISAEQIDYMLEWMYSDSALLSQMTEKGHHFILVKKGDDYLGYASYEFDYDGTDKVKIHKIYVDPTFQKCGAGRLLIEHIESIVRNENKPALMLDVNKNNPALFFYERMGFSKSGEKCADIGNGFVMDDYILEKKM